MATFKKHRDASDQFHQEMGDASGKAIKTFGGVLKSVGASLQDIKEEESPEYIAADAVVGAAETHAKFHGGALDALARAVKLLRKRPKA